ncbi:MAG TPA: hypothetical protein VHM30_13040, partial [Gemmatimonadaceae bacterium]|nr:hypothetical protein [Gemmatimonadaceae bacterium]
ALGCDKARQLATGGGEDSRGASDQQGPPADRLDLSSRPDILFQVYGERDDPRMIPVGVLRNGKLEQIELGESGWKQFDAIYGKAGAEYTVYDDGRAVGHAKVRQGMWVEGKDPLYTLPNCELMIPQAAMTLEARSRAGYTVSLFASTRALRDAEVTQMAQSEVDRIGRDVATRVARGAGISEAALAGLDLHAVAVKTGVSSSPTIIASMLDPRADEQSSAHERTVHLFVIADRTGDGGDYKPTYTHVLDGDAATGDFERFVDHLDVAGDGTSEIALDSWRFGGDTFLIFLEYKNGAWSELFRGRSNWCLDAGSR